MILAELHDKQVIDSDLLEREKKGEGFILLDCPLRQTALALNELMQIRVASTQKGHEPLYGGVEEPSLLDGPLGEMVLRPVIKLRSMKALIPALKNTLAAEYVMMVSRRGVALCRRRSDQGEVEGGEERRLCRARCWEGSNGER